LATTFSEAISRAPLKGFSIATFAVCMLVLICDGMDAQLLGIVAPKVIEDFGAGSGSFGWAMSASLVGFGIGSWGGGWLGDTLGRRWSLAIATVVFGFATVGASLTGGRTEVILDLIWWQFSAPVGVWEMAAWRLLSGLGFGSAYATAITLAGEWLPERWRSVGVTTLSVGTPAGGVVVGFLAPSLIEAYGWRGAFVAIGAGTALVVVLVLAVLRDSPSFLLARNRTEQARVAARKVLEDDVELSPERHLADRDGAAVGVFDRSNLRLNVGVGIAFAAATAVAYGMLNWATTFLPAKGFTFAEASYTVSVGGLTSIAAAIAVGLLVQRYGTKSVIYTLSAGLLLTLVVLTFRLESVSGALGASERWLIVALYGIAGMFFSGAIASFYALMTYAYPTSCRSSGIGFGIFIGRVGAIAASGLGGWVIELGEGSLVPFFAVLCVAAVLVSAAALIVDRHVPPAARKAASA
jgi:AAHS family 4-hydroxybenzoate transporter-like MFS transporter